MSTDEYAERVRAAFYGLAVCDALGGPLEFKQRRQSPAEYLREMTPNANFNLPAGCFTDDTSMALCLAASLSASKGHTDAVDQATRYVKWLDEGYMSAVPGPAFDVGNQTLQVLDYWKTSASIDTLTLVKRDFKGEMQCGNGSLMRVLPCPLIATSEDQARLLARESSEVTHPHQRCVDACVIYSSLVFQALNGASKGQLAQTLNNLGSDSTIDAQLRTLLSLYTNMEDWSSKSRSDISSSGYVLDSLEAALWAFFTTTNFEQGAIEVVNLGNDADTVGAIYGGLAGAFYGNITCIPRRWLRELKQTQLLDTAISGMIEMNRGSAHQ